MLTLPPFRFVFASRSASSLPPVRLLISVPKKKVGRAVDRNRLKRQIREAYRLSKPVPAGASGLRQTGVDVAILYFGKECADSSWISSKVEEGMKKITNLLTTSG